jgi:hypothetical protein
MKMLKVSVSLQARRHVVSTFDAVNHEVIEHVLGVMMGLRLRSAA